MIVTGLMNLVIFLVNLIPFSLPSLAADAFTALPTALGYITAGIGVLRAFIGDAAMSYLLSVMVLLEGVNLAYISYSLFWWVIRKIPLVGIRE